MHTLMSKTYEILLTYDFCCSNVFVLSLDCYTFYLKVLIWCKFMLSGLNKIIMRSQVGYRLICYRKSVNPRILILFHYWV